MRLAVAGPDPVDKAHGSFLPATESTSKDALKYLTKTPCQQLVIHMLAMAVAYNKEQEQHHWSWKADPSRPGYTRPDTNEDNHLLVNTTAIPMPDYHAEFWSTKAPLPTAELKKYEGLGTWPATYHLLNTLNMMVGVGADSGNKIQPTAG